MNVTIQRYHSHIGLMNQRERLKKQADDANAGDLSTMKEACYQYAISIKERDAVTAFRYFMRAVDAKGGHAAASYQVGKMFEQGIAVTQSDEMAALYFMISLNKGDVPAAYYKLSLMCADGCGGFQIDPNLAKERFQKAIEIESDPNYNPGDAEFSLRSFSSRGYVDKGGSFIAYPVYCVTPHTDPSTDFKLFKLNMN